MKKLTKAAPEKNPAVTQDFPSRLSELEKELSIHPTRETSEQLIKCIAKVSEALIEKKAVIQFTMGGKTYAAGHADVTYSGSNHVRGVRHIYFYAAGKPVLDIEGDFENQMFGTNFRFQNIDLYTPGEWEADFMKVTEELRHHVAKRKSAFKKKRDAEQSRLNRRS